MTVATHAISTAKQDVLGFELICSKEADQHLIRAINALGEIPKAVPGEILVPGKLYRTERNGNITFLVMPVKS